MDEQTQINLTPSPRVLRMLGQIDFKPWQCLAELIDNSVDAFLTERGEAVGMLFPQVNVEISSAADIRSGTGDIRVSDNAAGMEPRHLEMALKAGYSSNNPVDKLGLFGMGFNVATARLGGRTEVWTTRLEDDVWTGVRIDFDELERADTFHVPLIQRPKTAAEAQSHGTVILIQKLEQQRTLYLRSAGGLKATRDKLSRVYNKIIQDLGLRVIVAGSELHSRKFCTWDPKRSVDTKSDFGRVPTIIPIDEDLGSQMYCDDCWVWLAGTDDLCPSCGSSDRLRRRDRRISGWLGIQRFFDMNDYGIDLVRNGRVIEERSKTFFSWTNPETGEILAEYPVEQQHWGGRIVGELNIDFVPLASHQKDAFDKNSREWKQVDQVIRGEGPIIQVYRQRLGFPERAASYLARLHQGYRRGQPPGFRWLVPGDNQGRGVNKEPQLWAAEFWAGNPEYQTDEKWWDAVVLAENARSKGKGTNVPEVLTGAGEFPGAEPETPQDADVAGEPVEPTSHLEEDGVLSGIYELPDIPGSPKLDVSVQRLTKGALDGGSHVTFAAMRSRIEMTYDPHHRVFLESLTEPVDCLVNELSYQFLTRSSVTQREWPMSRVAMDLRSRYFPWATSSFGQVYDNATSLLRDVIEHYVEAFGSIVPIEDRLTAAQRDLLTKEVARRDRAGDDRVAEVIASGEFARYLGLDIAIDLIRLWPELALDGRFFSTGHEDVDADLRQDLVAQVVGPMRDLVWMANPEGMQAGTEEWKTMLGRALYSVRLLDAWRGNG